MTVDQRKNHIDAVNSTKVISVIEHLHKASDSPPTTSRSHARSLSVSLEEATTKVNIPNQLLNTPGQKPEARMVLSYSGKTPHMVTCDKVGDYKCDTSCANWKGMNICSHSVAVAEVNNQLKEFLDINKRRKSPNITRLVSTSAPPGRVKKGGDKI